LLFVALEAAGRILASHSSASLHRFFWPIVLGNFMRESLTADSDPTRLSTPKAPTGVALRLAIRSQRVFVRVALKTRDCHPPNSVAVFCLFYFSEFIP
jgi:hypothetical protein